MSDLMTRRVQQRNGTERTVYLKKRDPHANAKPEPQPTPRPTPEPSPEQNDAE